MALVSAQEASSADTFACSYHVFLSFRGEDTRKTFTDHIYTAFVNAGLQTFRDDDELERGEDIKPELEKAIQHSRSSVIVFSKDYASSKWCLDELVMILQRKRTSDHVVLPVFYDIDPSEVRKQTGSFAKAFAGHQKNRSLNKDKVKGWRAALAEVADLAGMVLQNECDGHEAKFIKKIVKVIEGKLSRTPLSVAPYLIGIDSRVKEINLWLQDGSSDVGIFVIYGIGGIGKTTIAQVVYNSNFSRFEGRSFLENIREISEGPNGLVQMQVQLLSDILGGRTVKLHSVSEGIIKIKDVISCKKVLLVLDDVDHTNQLDAVLRMRKWFYPGSKIIITTRCVGLLKAHQDVKVHNIETLSHVESLELFSWHAFGQDHPSGGYMELSESVVRYSGGLPLALQTLGSSLSGQSKDVWGSALKKLEVIPNSDIMSKLRISYDSLQDDHDQNMFLHIACFFIGNDMDVVVTILDGCDFFTIVGVQNLIDRCLVTIDKYKNVKMHQMIRDMGREIVRLESKQPEKRSRLWHHKDSLSVLREKNGSKKVEGLALNMHLYPVETPSRNSSKVVVETIAFKRMVKLRLLQLSSVQLIGGYEEFPKGLRWLYWLEFPLESIPCDFLLESLVVLEMHHSSLRKIWKGTKSLPSLKILDLSDSRHLIETGDFSLVSNLERLILKGCKSLVDVHESIGNLEKLVYLNMKKCKIIRKLPKSISMLKSLETLILSGCSSLSELPMEMRKMESLKVFQADGIPIDQLHSTTLPCSLVVLHLTNCNISDDAFPKDFGNLSSLQSLDLSHNPIRSLPDCIRGLTGLDHLAFSQCTRLESLVGLPRITELVAIHCESLERVTFQSISCLPEKFIYGYNFKLAEVEYWYKLVPIGMVDVEMRKLLGLCNLNSMEAIRMYTPDRLSSGAGTMHPIQGLYESGIFSTFLPRHEVPGQFSDRSEGSSVSFTVPPLLPNLRIRGLNIFTVYTEYFNGYSSSSIPNPLLLRVCNKTKGLKWIYAPSCHGVPDDENQVMWLSHWRLGSGLEGGDEVSVSVFTKPLFRVKECGIQLVHEQEDEMSTQHNTIVPSYLSDIGRDSSEFIPGTYYLGNGPFFRLTREYVLGWKKEVWFNDISGESNEETDTEERRQGDEPVAQVAAAETLVEAKRASRGNKILIMTAVFFLFLSLISLPYLSFLSKYFI
ncbi:PREDICTED: TMV resistance N [Prunus dulcis]|uniref:PREDICTED: TMV resistance N n=1 Tax=Prunus dulcis TaxID=3755 RepID=A0A5E4GEF4_PRUDU|nr:disease resistance protein RUN1-like [Prunus dulcis]VVA37992.1 PREDICTED: TMV resistance N [Prunus dulcis]